MNAKKVMGFIVCKSAFTQRNITSVGLVALFVFVYIMAGGKIDTRLPTLKEGANFGATEGSLVQQDPNAARMAPPKISEEDSKSVLGLSRSNEREAREKSQSARGSLFTPEEREEAEREGINKEGLVQGVETSSLHRRTERKLQRLEGKEQDALSAIEDRLKRGRTN